MASLTSSRTTSAKRRCQTPSSTDSNKSPASSSWMAVSASLVTWKGCASRILMPGNSISRLATINCSSQTKHCRTGCLRVGALLAWKRPHRNQLGNRIGYLDPSKMFHAFLCPGSGRPSSGSDSICGEMAGPDQRPRELGSGKPSREKYLFTRPSLPAAQLRIVNNLDTGFRSGRAGPAAASTRGPSATGW